MASPVSHVSGVCDISQRGAGHDALLAPGAWSAPLQNSLSVDETGALLTTGPMEDTSVVPQGQDRATSVGDRCLAYYVHC